MNKIGSILLVEDDPNDVYFTSRALRESGLESELGIVSDGQAAIDFLAASAEAASPSPVPLKPSLILLDLNLPRRSGLEVLDWIREHEMWKSIIVIVLTSSTSEADMDQAYTLGANSYIIKPSDATRLKELGQLLKAYWFGWNQLPSVRAVAAPSLG